MAAIKVCQLQFLFLYFVSLLSYKTVLRHKYLKYSYRLNDSNNFDIINTNEETPSKSFFLSKKSFDDIGVTDSLQGVIKSLGLERPSKIQVIAFANVYNGSSCIIADQTGSGKTLSYLLPLSQRLAELRNAKAIPPVSSRQPFIVIITPTSELARYNLNIIIII